MTAPDEYTRVEQRLVDLRSDGEVDQADVEALLDSSEAVDKRAGLKALVLTATGDYGCFADEVPSLAPYLRDENPNVRYNALQAIIELLPERDELLADLPVVVDLLDDESHRVAEKALDALAPFAKADAAAAGDAAGPVAEFLEADRSPVRKSAVWFLTLLVQEEPDPALVALDRLVPMIGDTYEMPEFDGEEWTTPMAHDQTRQDIIGHGHEERERHMTLREFAAEVLVVLADEHPDEVSAHTETLREQLTHEDPHVRQQALRVVTALGDERPGVLVDLADELTACFAPDRPEDLTAAAVKPLGLLASGDPERVVPVLVEHVDLLLALVDHEDPHVRGTAAGLLAHVGERESATVESAEARLTDLLEDERTFVRANAAWALAAVGSEEAAAALRAQRDNESDESVRASIDDALTTMP